MKELLRCMEELWKSGIVVVCAAGNSGPEPMTISLLGAGKDVITVGCNEGGYFGKAKNLCEDHSGRGPSIYAMKKTGCGCTGNEKLFRAILIIRKKSRYCAERYVNGNAGCFRRSCPAFYRKKSGDLK